MGYYVYENIPTSTVTIHLSVCGYVKRRGGPTKNGKWHGPFADWESALDCAKATGRRNARVCHGCGLILTTIGKIRKIIESEERKFWVNRDSARKVLHRGTCLHVSDHAVVPKWAPFDTEREALAAYPGVHKCEDCW